MKSQTLKLSIVVLIFGTERFLRRCIDSILKQSYKNIEVLLVNDCSPDKCGEIIEYFSKKDDRIKVINTDSEMETWHARFYGSKFATGDFIAFLDSDDYIGVDGYRLMMENAILNKSDIVIANHVLDYEKSGNKVVSQYNLPTKKILENDEIMDVIFKQDGIMCCYQFVWNKIFSMKICEKAAKDFKFSKNYLKFSDDILYNTVLFYYAKKLTHVNYTLNYYYVGLASTTSPNSTTPKKINAINNDVPLYFDYRDTFLKEKGIYEKYKQNIARYNYSAYSYCKFIIELSNMLQKDKNTFIEKITENFHNQEINNYYGDDFGFFNSQNCLFDSDDELLRKSIVLSNYKYISFDLFGTLVNKPFIKDDFFLVLEMEIEKEIEKKYKFSQIRKECEHIAKSKLYGTRNRKECVNIHMIYDEIADKYKIENSVLTKIKNIEIELEVKFAMKGTNISEIYKLAKICAKKIIIIADTFLMKETVEKILLKCGYDDNCKIYLSSELKLSKSLGGIYDYVIKDLACNPYDIFHIGDNPVLDYEKPKMKGLNAYIYHNKEELLLNISSRKYTGDSLAAINMDNLLTRLSLAVVANKYFDNPYIHFSPPTDYNADPYFIGYYPVGMHMLSVIKWLIEDLISNNCESISFDKSSGVLVKNCYDIIAYYYEKAPKSKYITSQEQVFFDIKSYSITYDKSKNSNYYNILPYSDESLRDIIISMPESQNDNIDKFIYDNIHGGVTDFISDILTIHGNLVKQLKDERSLSIAFEVFLLKGKERDKRLFSASSRLKHR